MLALFCYKLGAFCARFLPGKLSSALASALGNLEYLLRSRLRRNVVSNLRLILGKNTAQEELDRLSRNVFKYFAENIRLFLRIPSIDKNELLSLVDDEEVDPVLEKLDPTRGFIIVTGHIGPWEIGGMYLAARGYAVNTVALDHPSPLVTRFFSERRALAGMRAHDVIGSFEALKTALERGECVVLLIDRAYKSTDASYEFFGVRRELPNSHLLLAARYRVPILPGAFLYRGNGRFKGILRGPYCIPDNLAKEAGMEMVQRRCLDFLETIIRTHPDQYFEFTSLRDHET